MLKKTVLMIVVLILASGLYAKVEIEKRIIGSIKVDKSQENQYLNLTKITLSQATELAKKRVPGKVREANLENENGFLVYSVLVATLKGGLKEVTVDSGNGRILAISDEMINSAREGDHDDD